MPGRIDVSKRSRHLPFAFVPAMTPFTPRAANDITISIAVESLYVSVLPQSSQSELLLLPTLRSVSFRQQLRGPRQVGSGEAAAGIRCIKISPRKGQISHFGKHSAKVRPVQCAK